MQSYNNKTLKHILSPCLININEFGEEEYKSTLIRFITNRFLFDEKKIYDTKLEKIIDINHQKN